MLSYHQAIQKNLKTLIPGSHLEYRFRSIKRVADLAFLPKKVVFEIQCSPISLEEVLKRNKDYSILGFIVIWVLHDKLYNKKIATPAELFLRNSLSIYTSITPFGHGFYYDQLDFFKGTKRIFKSAPFLLESLIPRKAPVFPHFFPKKFRNRSHVFQGDAPSNLLLNGQGKWAYKLEKKLTQNWSVKKIIQEIFHSHLQRHALSSHKF